MIYGSCLCGQIEFAAEEMSGMVFNCHCSRCRKSHGSAFSTQILAHRGSLSFSKGKSLLSEYKAPTAVRAFCSQCGSRLMNYGAGDSSYLSVSISALKDSKGLRPIGECFVLEKMEFTRLDEAIPHYAALPEVD